MIRIEIIDEVNETIITKMFVKVYCHACILQHTVVDLRHNTMN